MMFYKYSKTALILLLLFTALTGLLYPLAITGIAEVVFPDQSEGSLIIVNGTIAGSRLIGQPFSDPKYFWSRPSATAPSAYNAGSSSGSNLGPLNPALREEISRRVNALRDADPLNHQPIPIDLVTSSGSGLDPHISVAAALYQLPRVARCRGMTEELVARIVNHNTEDRQLGVLGEPRVNVLLVNLELDQYETSSGGN